MIAGALARFTEQGWLNIVGGCCGTTPEHIRAIARGREGREAAPPAAAVRTHVSGIDYVECEEAARPLIVGERTNEVGSREVQAS